MSDPISIQDLESGQVDVDAVLVQLDALHNALGVLRAEMHLHLTTLATLSDNSAPSSVYQEVAQRLIGLRAQCETFYGEYRRVVPMVRYFKIKQGMSPDDSLKVIPHNVSHSPVLLGENGASGIGGGAGAGSGSGTGEAEISIPPSRPVSMSTSAAVSAAGSPNQIAPPTTTRKTSVKGIKKKVTKK